MKGSTPQHIHFFIKPFTLPGMLILLAACFFLNFRPASAQSRIISQNNTRVLFILDASGSMEGKWNNTNKMSAAKSVLARMTDSLRRENIDFAVRVFGHQSPRDKTDCNDTRLELPFGKTSQQQVQVFIGNIQPKGHSPIALSLEQAISDFPLSKTESKNVIILITDGFENCSGNACEASLKLQSAGIYLRPYIIGLGLSEDQKKLFDCVGIVYDMKEEASTTIISHVIITNILNPTTLQINLLNEAERPTETNVNMTFKDIANGQIRYNIFHTINAAGNPDTLYVDPSSTYQVKVHTLPSVTLKNVQLVQGKHVTKAIEAAQGSMRIQMTGAMKYKSLKCIVRKDNKIINVQDINSTQNYLTDSYDLEVLTLPRMYFSDVMISQSKQKVITIASPGTLNLRKTVPGYLTIFKKEDQELIYVYTVSVNNASESVQLQPGSYELLFRAKNAQSTKSSITKKVNITSSIATTISF